MEEIVSLFFWIVSLLGLPGTLKLEYKIHSLVLTILTTFSVFFNFELSLSHSIFRNY